MKSNTFLHLKKVDKDKNNVDDRFDWVVKVCAVILPFTTIDQLHLIYIKKETAGVSPITWFLYGLLSVPLLIYSIQRKDVPMIILNGLWVIVDFAVWIGILIV